MPLPLALAVVNEALLALGEKPLDSLDDGAGTAAAVAAALYQPRVDELLGGHPWTFNRRLERLARLAAPAPEACGFSARYQLPGLCFRVVCPFVGGSPAADWGQAADALFLDADPADAVELEFHTRVEPNLWRPGFRQAVVWSLASSFAVPITDSESRAALMDKMAQAALARARHQNATEKPAGRLPTGRLAARMRRP